MRTFQIPGWKTMSLRYLVCDYNGTLATDGKLLDGIAEKLKVLAEIFEIHVVTADTFGLAARELEGLPCRLKILPKEDQAEAKRTYVKALGAENTVAIGNGRNDRLMLQEAALGMVLMQEEGAAVATLTAADVVCPSAIAAFDLLLHPQRLTATLRG